MVPDERLEKALEDIETLQEELAQLKTDHTQVTTQLRHELLEIRRLAAQMKVNSDSQTIRDIIQRQLPNSSNLKAQEVKDMTDAKARIETSTRPLEIANEYQTKWFKLVQDSGAKITIT